MDYIHEIIKIKAKLENLINAGLGADKIKKGAKKMSSPQYKDGSIRTRNNKIEYRFMHDKKQLSVYGETIKECFKKRTEIIKGQSPTNTKKITIEQWLDIFYETYKKPFNGERSLHEIKRYIENEIKPNIGKKEMQKATLTELQNFINKYQEKPNTQKKIADIINSAFKMAVADEIITKNPFEKRKIIRYTKQSYRALEFDEQTKIHENAEGEYKKLFFIACCTGIRIGKLLELTDKDIDIERKVITVIKKQTKGQSETYKVPFLEKLLQNEQPKGKLFAGIKYKRCQEYFQELFKKLNIERANIHSFRHTFGSICYHIGINLKQIQLWLGHNTFEMTANIYTHLLNKSTSPIKEYLQELKEQLNI